jgi:hydrogenase expression/formation protein HypC
MCLAVPAQVKSITGLAAEVDIGGVGRTISLMLMPEVRVGDYVYVHAGFAISIVEEAEALESLRLLRELAETYPVDELYATTGDLPRRDEEYTPAG